MVCSAGVELVCPTCSAALGLDGLWGAAEHHGADRRDRGTKGHSGEAMLGHEFAHPSTLLLGRNVGQGAGNHRTIQPRVERHSRQIPGAYKRGLAGGSVHGL